MGTSSSYGGQGGKTPLIPSWLGPAEDAAPPAPPPLPPDDQTAPAPSPSPDVLPITLPAVLPPMPPAADQGRFIGARNNFSRFASSAGRDRASLGRAAAHYVARSSGGARSAAQRMGSSRATAAKLLNFLSSATGSGVSETLRALKLENLVGLPIQEIFLGLADYICPDGGTVDEGIAREAFIETIADLSEAEIGNLDSLTQEQIQTICELYATNAIEARIYNDIGANGIAFPEGIHDAVHVEAELHDFIYRSVSDAFTAAHHAMQAVTPDRVLGFITRVYEQAFAILQSLGEAEGDK